MPTKKLSHNATYFNMEQLNEGFHFPLPYLLKQFLYFTKVLPTFLHPNVVWVLIGYNILNMLYHLDFYLLEVLFVYTLKMSQKERFSLFVHIPSLQLVMGLPDSNKDGARGHVLVSGPWSGLYKGLDREFHPRCSL